MYAYQSIPCHHPGELLKVDLPVAVHIGLADHLIDFFVCELFAEGGHDHLKLSRRDLTIAIFVKNLKGLV